MAPIQRLYYINYKNIKMMDIEANQRNAESNLPWVEKYRPETLGDLISHEAILDTCKSMSI